MRAYVGDQEAWDAVEFEELAYGIDRELFLGSPGESDEERAARLAAARDILDDLRREGLTDEVTAWDALYAEALSLALPLHRPAARSARGTRWSGDAA